MTDRLFREPAHAAAPHSTGCRCLDCATHSPADPADRLDLDAMSILTIAGMAAGLSLGWLLDRLVDVPAFLTGLGL